MKKVIDRFVAEDVDGRRYTVICVQDCIADDDLGTAFHEVGVSYLTTVGELLTTSDNVSFNVVDTNRFLHKVDVARTAQGVLRFRSFSMGVVAIN